ncbi:HTH_Tnp_Tc3_2 domain-containing protein [Trichonephila clavipes]|nr:HTH_Tnp_Tc3_2 domain-containing protein [Trichonephila clavipes]
MFLSITCFNRSVFVEAYEPRPVIEMEAKICIGDLWQCRLDFCRPRATWSVTDWRRVIFSDESRFSLSADDHRTCLEAHRPAVRSGIYCRAASQGVTVWGGISWDTRSSLVLLQGTLTAQDTWTIF